MFSGVVKLRKLVGYDLNGWNDFGAKNWLEVPGQETDENTEQLVRGGIGGVVVRVGGASPEAEKFIGGMQALRSPHGRGPGWGEIGSEERRISVRSIIDNAPGNQSNQSALAGSLSAMASARKATVVLAIPDLPELDEDKQEALLSSLRHLKPGRRLLVWRTVLAVIAALNDETPQRWKEGHSIGVIGHHARGLTVQVLKLRREKKIAPEREHVGELIECDLGLESFLRQASNSLKQKCENPHRSDHITLSNLPHQLAIEGCCDAEPLRLQNLKWEIIEPPSNYLPAAGEVPSKLVNSLTECDHLLLETPTSGRIRGLLVEKLQGALDREVHALKPEAVAIGALEAARRLSENEPVYYDFLPQVSTIVHNADGPQSYDLIPPGALLPAGQSYQSDRPACLGLIAGTDEIKVHLKKQSDPTPRRDVVKVPIPPQTNTPVELHLQQTPAAGHARLTLVSKAFASPLVVDWGHAQELEQSWEDAIESLKSEEPSVPKRLVLPCSSDNWLEPERGYGLIELLENNLDMRVPDWESLANKVSMRRFEKYSVSSDGELPKDIPDSAHTLLKRAVELAEQDVRARLNGEGTNENQSLRFLTWLFKMCPEWIVTNLLDALDFPVGKHPFILAPGSKALVLQGIGRTATNFQQQRRAFDHLLSLPKERWKKDQMACAAFLLSRNDSAPLLLDREEVDFIASVAQAKVHEAVGKIFSTAYSYGPFLLVGLLRWRKKKAWALVAGHDPVADKLLTATQSLAEHLGRLKISDSRLEKYHEILTQVCKELEGEGTNPDILVDLQSFAGN